ncbi:hypothetical protein Tco_0001061 [Tanacetum coccineum]
MTRSSTNELYTSYKDPEREFRSSRRHFKTLSLDELRSSDFNLLSDEEYSEEEVEEEMVETTEQYMSKTRTDYGSSVARPKIDNIDQFELKGKFLKELRENTFSSSDNEDANEHIEELLDKPYEGFKKLIRPTRSSCFNYETKIHVDNESAICVVKNPVYHSKTKHIEIRHHFIRDSYEKRLIEMVKIHTDNNVADLLTKAFDNDGNTDFHQILDFLTSSSIKFALTVSPTIFASYIEQFWNITSLKTINSEKQIHAKVNVKAVVVLESSMRRDLYLNDEDVATATASQPPKDPNTYKRTKRSWNTKVPQSGGSPKKVGDEAINEEIFDSEESAITTDASLDAVLDLEKEKDAQAVEILNDDLDEEDASKQGRKNDKTNPMLHESDFDGFDDETVDAATTGVSTASAPVTTASVAISTVEPRTPPTTTVFDDEDVTMAMAQTLIKIKE